MDILELSKNIELQIEVLKKVQIYINEKYNEYSKYVEDLINPIKAEDTFISIDKIYNSIDNYETLSIYLLACLKVYEKYTSLGIDKNIYFDTMRCFTRFIDECKQKTGNYYFDRQWWTYRQVSMKLFRIGELEYEMDNNLISIHIPSDAVLTRENICKSIISAKKFFKEYYKDYKDSIYICDSWLLSLKLKDYLDENSNILTFQSFFDIVKYDEDNKSFMEWLFKTNDVNLDINLLKEDTKLQKKIKQALKDNVKIGSAFGKLKDEVISL